MVTPPDEIIADPYAVIAALRQQLADSWAERDAALRALAERAAEPAYPSSRSGKHIQPDTDALRAENEELHAAQTAGLEVLRAMVTSPADPQPIFELIARRASEVCNAPGASVLTFDGSLAHFAALYPPSGYWGQEAIKRFRQSFPRQLHRESFACRAMLERRTIHIRDVP